MKIQKGDCRVEITKELQETLKANQPLIMKRPKAVRKQNDLVGLIAEKDENGEIVLKNTIKTTHPYVYFDKLGNHYFSVYKVDKDPDGRNILLPLNLKDIERLTANLASIEKGDNVTLLPMYGRGEYSHSTPIPNSQLWDNGKDSDFIVKTAQAKGIESSKIVVVMTAEEVLAVNLKPQDNSVMSKIINLSDSEREVTTEALIGKDLWNVLKGLASGKLTVSENKA